MNQTEKRIELVHSEEQQKGKLPTKKHNTKTPLQPGTQSENFSLPPHINITLSQLLTSICAEELVAVKIYRKYEAQDRNEHDDEYSEYKRSSSNTKGTSNRNDIARNENIEVNVVSNSKNVGNSYESGYGGIRDGGNVGAGDV